jgi:DNA-binding NarL/FixJ family response regulator
MKILLVDDSQLILTKIKELLEEVEFISSIKTCRGYDDAVELMDTFNPKVLLLDINLPGKSGIELLRYTKANKPKARIIMVSNQSGKYYRDLCFELGADGFIDKSKDFADIPDILFSLS